MKVFTQVGQQNYDQVKPENINDNTKAVIGEYNGKIDGQNFPVGTIDKLKMAPSVKTDTASSDVKRFKFIGQTQDYYFVRRWNTFEAGLNIHLPAYTFDLQNSNWSSGWNNLADIHSDFNKFVLEFDSESGTLHGCFDINYRHGLDVITDDTPANVVFGNDWWTRWGIFCNDVLVAETGRVYPRLQNLTVPFKLFVGAQPVRLELRWQTITTSPREELGVTTNPTSRMEIYGASIWACNTKR